MARSPLLVAAFAGAVAMLSAGCGDGRGDPPPSPTSAFEPAVVSLITSVEQEAIGRRVLLADGTTLNLNPDDPSSPRLTNGTGQVIPGDLVLAGPGSPPSWWAALSTRHSVHPSGAPGSAQVPDGRCWYIRGGAYDEGTVIHFSSGLRLPKAPGFEVSMDWIPDPFPARGSDSFCVDQQGIVTSLDFIWVGGY
jgi:hypothetical protein